jgi:hypothetical protein
VGSSRSPETAKLGVPSIRLDYADFSTIPAALEGVERLFILTGYTVDMLRQGKAQGSLGLIFSDRAALRFGQSQIGQ